MRKLTFCLIAITCAALNMYADAPKGVEMVDLGLPTGTLWANMNVGATTPEGYGDYFAWGETSPKTTYDWSTYKHCQGSENNLIKYCTDSIYGIVDNKAVLDPEDDAAHVNWGGNWRMPTKAEQDELRTKCTWTWTQKNGINGYDVKGPNGNSIFLPASGYRFGSSLYYVDSYGYGWSSSLYSSYSSSAYNLSFNSDSVVWIYYDRYSGLSVRPVISPASNIITYTATEKLPEITDTVGAGLHVNAFNVAISSHTFSNGVGTITFEGEVTTIGEGAFYGCSGLTSITIPNSVTTIGEYAFYKCSGLTSINVDVANTHYVSIDGVLFNHAKDTLIQCPAGNSRTEYTIPNSVTTIGFEAFSSCIGLTSVTIPNSVTTIGGEAFDRCSSLTSVTIPNSVTKIRSEAFCFCSGLTKTNYTGTIADWCKIEFGNGASNPMCCSHNFFINDVEIKDLVIPQGVDKIGKDAFYDCSSLTSVTIPNSVTTIGDWAFYDCIGLTSITCETTTPPTCGARCFYNVDKSIPVYVPIGSVEAYKSAEQWKDFTDIRPITAQEVEVTEIEAEPTESTVEIAWPIIVNAETYTIEIHLGDKLICSIIFNAQGQLLSINFNPAPSRGHTYATTAEGTATGWAYTIAGLNPGTNYTYSVVAKSASDQVIDTKKGSFTTTAPTGLLDVNDNSKFLIQNSKLIKNGHLYILRDGNLYTATGARVK